MPKPANYIFILWGDSFEEAVAAIFVSELREAGLRVKVVSVSRQQTPGAHGLTLVPDLTLTQAIPLARQTSCVIIPCELRVLQHLKNDPRLREFFSLARTNQARILIGSLSGSEVEAFEYLSLSPEAVTVYPANEDLVEFARRLAGSLAILR